MTLTTPPPASTAMARCWLHTPEMLGSRLGFRLAEDAAAQGAWRRRGWGWVTSGAGRRDGSALWTCLGERSVRRLRFAGPSFAMFADIASAACQGKAFESGAVPGSSVRGGSRRIDCEGRSRTTPGCACAADSPEESSGTLLVTQSRPTRWRRSAVWTRFGAAIPSGSSPVGTGRLGGYHRLRASVIGGRGRRARGSWSTPRPQVRRRSPWRDRRGTGRPARRPYRQLGVQRRPPTSGIR